MTLIYSVVCGIGLAYVISEMNQQVARVLLVASMLILPTVLIVEFLNL